MDDVGSGGLRFGVVNEVVASGPAWRDHVRAIEDAGVDVFLVRDHFTAGPFGPQLAPITALSTAAAITTRLHVGTLVLSNDFRHPALVAHEAATLSHLSGGRFELGLGAGWFQPEYDAAGLAFDPAGRRIERLEQSLAIITRLFDGEDVDLTGSDYRITGLNLDVLRGAPRPRLLVGGGGPRMLRLAARYADSVGLLPAPIRGSDEDDDPQDRRPAALERKIAVVREAAGPRFEGMELSAFVTIRITERRRSATEELIAERGWTTVGVEDVWEMPTVHVGSVATIRDDILERRERYGLRYLVTSDRDLPALAELLAAR